EAGRIAAAVAVAHCARDARKAETNAAVRCAMTRASAVAQIVVGARVAVVAAGGVGRKRGRHTTANSIASRAGHTRRLVAHTRVESAGADAVCTADIGESAWIGVVAADAHVGRAADSAHAARAIAADAIGAHQAAPAGNARRAVWAAAVNVCFALVLDVVRA